MKTFSFLLRAFLILFVLILIGACGGGPSNSGGANPPPVTPTAVAPTFSPAAGSYATTQNVTLATTTPEATIYYTTDGSVPATTSSQYTAGIAVGTTQTLNAIAVAPGYKNSGVATALYTITPPPHNTAYIWKNVEIVAGGFITGIVFHPSQPGLIYARTDIGGAYRWDNVVQRWIPLNDWIGFADWNYMGIESIGLDPSDPQRLYLAAGTYMGSWVGNGAILVSADQGNTFSVVPMPIKMGANENGRFAGERLAVDPNKGSIVYFGSRVNGLWKSTDHGSTWNQVTQFPVTGPTNGAGVIFVNFVKSSGTQGTATPVMYVGVSARTSPHLYQSNDAGATWTAVPDQPVNHYPNHGVLGPDGTLYLSYGNDIGPNGMTGGAIWRYKPGGTSGGASWANITPSNLPYEGLNGTGYAHGWGCIAVDAQRPGVVMASTMDLWYQHDGIVRSADGGLTWIDLGETSVRDASLAPYLNWGGTAPPVGNWIGTLAIDPFDSSHVLYGTGATIWATNEVTHSEPGTQNGSFEVLRGRATNWTVGALGIEETAVIKLLSPPTGVHLISALGDINGFVHDDLAKSPAGGMQNPLFSTTTGIDFAQNAASVIARVGNTYQDASPFGAYSADGGATWSGFTTAPTTGSGGTIAVSADGNTFVWSANIVDANHNITGGKVAYSTDRGATWATSTGAPQRQPVFSDRVNKDKFYIIDASARKLYVSTDRGATFTVVNNNLQGDNNDVLSVSWAAEGDLWFSTRTGLFHSTDSGVSFTNIGTVQEAYALGFGKAADGATFPALYLAGKVGGTQAIFRSIDKGASWVRVNDDQHQYGWISVISGDPRVFGRVYFGANGRGIIYGDPAP